MRLYQNPSRRHITVVGHNNYYGSVGIVSKSVDAMYDGIDFSDRGLMYLP